MQLGEIYHLAEEAFGIDFEDAVVLRDAYTDKDKFLVELGYQIARKDLIDYD